MSKEHKAVCVIAWPAGHSRSPLIHNYWIKQHKLNAEYRREAVPPEKFVDFIGSWSERGYVGANVTLPHKEAAFALCHHISERARRAGAVNTLTRHADGWGGDNTDGVGLVCDLTERHALDLRSRRTLLLGAGGAAHGVAPALLDAGIGDLFIINRSPEKADALADKLGMPGRVHTRYWNDLRNLGSFDFIVNATSAGRDSLQMDLPFAIATRRSLAVDLSYGEAATAFLSWARAAGCGQAIDGLGMLVEQAAESFALWHGRRPETDAIYAELNGRSVALHTAD